MIQRNASRPSGAPLLPSIKQYRIAWRNAQPIPLPNATTYPPFQCPNSGLRSTLHHYSIYQLKVTGEIRTAVHNSLIHLDSVAPDTHTDTLPSSEYPQYKSNVHTHFMRTF